MALSCWLYADNPNPERSAVKLKACGWSVERVGGKSFYRKENRTIWDSELPRMVGDMTGGILVTQGFSVPEGALFACEQKGITVLDFSDACLIGQNHPEELIERLQLKLPYHDSSLVENCLKFLEDMKKPPLRPRRRGRIAYGERPGEAAIKQDIIAMHQRGLSFNEIAKKLNDDRIKTPTGKQWRRQQIKNIIERGKKQSGRT